MLLNCEADHMPPKSVVKQMNSRWHRRLLGIRVRQRFYPQCLHCSKKQSNFLSDASRKIEVAKRKGYILKRTPNLAMSGGGGHAHVHLFRPRREHLAGATLASATVGNSDEMDIVAGSRVRFHNWQLKVEETFYKCLLEFSSRSKKFMLAF